MNSDFFLLTLPAHYRNVRTRLDKSPEISKRSREQRDIVGVRLEAWVRARAEGQKVQSEKPRARLAKLSLGGPGHQDWEDLSSRNDQKENFLKRSPSRTAMWATPGA